SARLAGGPTRDRVLAFGRGPNVDVGRGSRAGHVKSEQALLPVAVKLEAGNVRGGQRRIENRFLSCARAHRVAARGDLDHMQRADAIFVQRVRDPLAVRTEVPDVDVEFYLGQQIGVPPAGEIDVS